MLQKRKVDDNYGEADEIMISNFCWVSSYRDNINWVEPPGHCFIDETPKEKKIYIYMYKVKTPESRHTFSCSPEDLK